MCGICGVWTGRSPTTRECIERMTRSLNHRGPDGEGVYVNPSVALGHKRLSIIDLSRAATQPMANEDESLWLVFNGEVYNFRERRAEIEHRHRFVSRSDGEVILHLYEERGDATPEALDGMFAFALWDSRRRRLLLARDRAGKKPLYYYANGGMFAFGSEIKALLAHEGVSRELAIENLPLYLTYGYVPTPDTLYRGIHSLPPGHLLVVDENGVGAPRSYWQPRFNSPGIHDDQAIDERLRDILRAAVRKRLVADVPLGVFLSGGLDSSTVVAFMAEEAAGRVRTFSIGFAGGGPYDETEYARLVARHFATDHTEFIVEPRALDLIDRLVWHHDGPFGDSSAIPTYLLSELTRAQVTVALNGDGGDEVFAGYRRLFAGDLSERFPRVLFARLAALMRFLPEPADRKHPLRFAKRFIEAGRLPLMERYLRWNAFFTDDLDQILRPEFGMHCERKRILKSFSDNLDFEGSTLAKLLQLNFRTYLPDDLLVKMDRMSMAHGLETRSPLLDTQVVEFGMSLPDCLRVRWGRGKYVLRRAMRELLPTAILDRGKMGFGAPLASWFREDLGDFVRERLLDPGGPLQGYLRQDRIEALVHAHMAAAADMSPQIWALLTLESWLRQARF